MIIEAMPIDPNDYVYSKQTNPSFMSTLIQAFNDANVQVKSIDDIINLGIYLTTTIKCSKIGYGISAKTIENCSFILEQEIKQFPVIEVVLLMGDVAIKAFNYISKRTIGHKTIPIGSTYKIRNEEFFYKNIRILPSYLPIGQNYLIEKSKRKMIAEDITQALKIIDQK
ncbi:MAG: uracil-DNA glycosylase [Candidatus Heimdallarchaeota archaeon]|nr:uracil-DNA glycosylase [Candidatus Heimdallarchaeota archaeon]